MTRQFIVNFMDVARETIIDMFPGQLRRNPGATPARSRRNAFTKTITSTGATMSAATNKTLTRFLHDPGTTEARLRHDPGATPARPRRDPGTTPAQPRHDHEADTNGPTNCHHGHRNGSQVAQMVHIWFRAHLYFFPILRKE